MLDEPLSWLDNQEKYIGKHINRDFRTKINLIESLISLITKYVTEILKELPRFKDMKDLERSSKGDRLRRIMAGLLLDDSIERLFASRRMLLSGYQGRMLACLRDMWEALYYSDICLQSETMSRKWFDGQYLPRPKDLPKTVKINDRIRGYREGWRWDTLSTCGVHPTMIARIRSVSYRVPVETSLSKALENMSTSELYKLEKDHTYINIWMAIFAIYSFLKYLRDIYPSIYKRNSVIRSDVDKLDRRFGQHCIFLRKKMREKDQVK